MLRVPRKVPAGKAVRAEDEKDLARQIQSAKTTPGRWNSVCKNPKGSRLLCLQNFVGVTITGAGRQQVEGGQTWTAAGSTVDCRAAGESHREVKPWVPSQQRKQNNEQETPENTWATGAEQVFQMR